MTSPASNEEEIARLNEILREALLELAARGAADQSCRLAAAAWSALREHHEREAERLTALLHSLARKSNPILQQGVQNHE
ncbi:MAG: hypothetical protein ACREFP_03445 [Acetobacteraceae bacterium]